MRKGIGLLQWIFISLALTLLIVAVIMTQLQGAIDELIKMNKRYQALEVAGIINALQASPIETTHAYSSPLCVEIVDRTVEIKDYSIEHITSPVEVEPGTFGCGEGGKYFVREDKIRIRS